MSADSRRAVEAAMRIIDDRDMADSGEILITLELAIATVMLAVFDRDPRMAAAMFHEGVAPNIDDRLAAYSARKK